MYIFKNSSTYTDPSEPHIARTRSESGEDWYKAQNNFHEGTIKVVFLESSGDVIAFSSDVSKLFPTEGTSVIEVDNLQMSEDMRYVVNRDTLSIVENESYKKRSEVARRLASCESNIALLRERLDELDCGIITDASPSYKDQMKEWVSARKQLNEYDTDGSKDIPSIPTP